MGQWVLRVWEHELERKNQKRLVGRIIRNWANAQKKGRKNADKFF